MLVLVLSVSFLVAVISPPPFLCSLRVVVLMRQRCLQCWRILFVPFLISIVCPRHLLNVMSYAWSLVFSFIGQFAKVFSLVHFIKDPEYLTRSTAQVFIPLIRFLQHRFVSSSFLVLLRYSFLFFSSICTCLIGSVSKIPKYWYVSFSSIILIMSWFGSSIPSVRCRLQFFVTCMAYFSMKNSISMS